MNTRKRKLLSEALDEIEKLSADTDKEVATQHTKDALSLIETCYDEESVSLDNLPESLTFSDMYTKIEENIGDLESIISDMEEILDTLSKCSNYNYQDVRECVVSATNDINAVIER